MTKQLWKIVGEYRNKGVPITDEEAEEVCEFCYRKMEVGKVENREEYLPLLFADEIRNYLFRLAVNATTALRMMGEEAAW